MSDEAVREAERRWLASGDPADRLRWLLGRVRSGELSPGARGLVEAVERGERSWEQVQLRALAGCADAWTLAGEEVRARLAAEGSGSAARVAAGAEGLRWTDLAAWLLVLDRGDPRLLPAALRGGSAAVIDGLARSDLTADRTEDELWSRAEREAARDSIVTLARRYLLARSAAERDEADQERRWRSQLHRGDGAWRRLEPYLEVAWRSECLDVPSPLGFGGEDWLAALRRVAAEPAVVADGARRAALASLG